MTALKFKGKPMSGDQLAIEKAAEAIRATAVDPDTVCCFEGVMCATPPCACAKQLATAALTALERDAGMRAFSASDAACYLWPEDTDEHKALRMAYIRGAASTALQHPLTPIEQSATFKLLKAVENSREVPIDPNICREAIAENIQLREAIDAPTAFIADKPTALKSNGLVDELLSELRKALCPGGGYIGQPENQEPTVQACLDAGVCGCEHGAAVERAEAIIADKRGERTRPLPSVPFKL